MIIELLAFLLGIILTTFFFLWFFLIKCKNCGKYRQVVEIVRIKRGKIRQLAGQHCGDCQKNKGKMFDFGDGEILGTRQNKKRNGKK